jgi:DNA (cytosine-5)-methyltransferase 1
MTVPVVDLFAGPGGLGEGFSRSNVASFRVAVSIEKDPMAYQTLRLRAAHRQLMRTCGPRHSVWRRWDSIIGTAPWQSTFDALATSPDDAIRSACESADREAWHCEMGPHNRDAVTAGITQRLRRDQPRSRRLPDNIVMIGGPPCQAYSIVGRSRNRGNATYRPELDHRHYLYLEYLHAITRLRPAVFVMENVKGMLSSSVLGQKLFDTIRVDLSRPDQALGEDHRLEYRLVTLAANSLVPADPHPQDFIVRAEDCGVPQARHRVVICGVRRDLISRLADVPRLPQVDQAPTVLEAIGDLPRLHPRVSFRGSGSTLADCFTRPLFHEAVRELRSSFGVAGRDVAAAMQAALLTIRSSPDLGHGFERLEMNRASCPSGPPLMRWFVDRQLSVMANHETRAHMPDDLIRYLFIAAFGSVHKRSPKLRDFPRTLLPQHANVDATDIESTPFKDRFRVQVKDACSTTVTSHIGKDGHAFIHYDPSQCRSLTVREAARLQTFPDSYVFLGTRTSQYVQVGNAVPPLLAMRIADSVGLVLRAAGLA